jgi:hypothetical protein
MPEAPIYKDGKSLSRKDKIGMAEDVLMSPPAAYMG